MARLTRATQHRVRVPKAKRTKHIMKGGPWDGQALYLTCPGTLPIRVQGQSGRYDQNNTWVAAQ